MEISFLPRRYMYTFSVKTLSVLMHVGATTHKYIHVQCTHIIMMTLMTLPFCMEVRRGIPNYNFFVNPLSSYVISPNHTTTMYIHVWSKKQSKQVCVRSITSKCCSPARALESLLSPTTRSLPPGMVVVC